MSTARFNADAEHRSTVGPRCREAQIDSYGLGQRRSPLHPDEFGAFCVRTGIEGVRFVFRRVAGESGVFDVIELEPA